MKCGEAYLPEGAGTFVCQTCQGRDFFFDYAVSPYQSRGVLRELIHRFKYQRQLFLGPLLGSLLVDVLQDERIVDLRQDWVAVPVPLHARRYREREFNQALELCRELQERSGIPYVNALKRTRYTSSQTRYRREQRMENLSGEALAIVSSALDVAAGADGENGENGENIGDADDAGDGADA